MFIFNDFSSFSVNQIEKIIGSKLILDEFIINNYHFNTVTSLFSFESEFISTDDGRIIGIEYGMSMQGYKAYAINKELILAGKTDWYLISNEIYEHSNTGYKAVLVSESVYDCNWRQKKTILKLNNEKVRDKYAFVNKFERKIAIDKILENIA